MKKKNSFISVILILIIFNLFTVSNAHAIGGGALVKFFTKITQYFSKAGKGVASKTDDISKIIGKSDETRIIEKGAGKLKGSTLIIYTV